MNIIRLLLLIVFTNTISSAASKKIVIDLNKQMAYAYKGERLIYSGWVSSGRKEFKTKGGKFRVLQKEKLHISNEWPKSKKSSKPDGGAKMPYMLRITWSGIALHAGYTPNYPASHGCIRLEKKLAKKLFNWARIGTKVIIKGRAPKRVTRVYKKFTNHLIERSNRRYVKKRKRVKKRVAKRSKSSSIVNKYSKYSYKKLNRILVKNSKRKEYIISSNKLSKRAKIKKLREIKWLVSTIKKAKDKKYRRVHKKKRRANLIKRVYKKVSSRAKRSSYIKLDIKSAKAALSFGHLATL